MALSMADRCFRKVRRRSARAMLLACLVWLLPVSVALSAHAIGINEDGAAAQLTHGALDPAATYVTSLIEEVVPHLLATPSAQRPQELRRLLEENVDASGIARFAMGRYWRLADDDERTEFVRLFFELLVQTSDAGLADYKSDKFRVAETRPADDNGVVVRSALRLRDGPSVQIEWRLRREMERFKIQDVIVEGISIRIALRDVFAAAIHEKGGTIGALLAAMRELAQSGTRAAP